MRIEKITLGDWVTATFKDSSYLFFISYQGLTVAQISEFRGKLQEVGATCTVMKNTYIKLGLQNMGCQLPGELPLSGDTAVIHGDADPCPVAKAILDFGKTNERIAVKGGLIDGSFIQAGDAKALTDLPPKPVLQAQLLGTMLAPMTNLVRVLNAPPTQLVQVLNNQASSILNVLNAYQNKLEQQAS